MVMGDGAGNLYSRFWVSTVYDGSMNEGLAFMWWGAAGWGENIDIEVRTPTGRLRGSFGDGPSIWRWVFLPWSSFTWYGSPNLRLIDGIFWTYDSVGIRRLDLIGFYSPGHLYATFIARHDGAESLKALLTVRNTGTEDLFIDTIIRHTSSRDLFVELLPRYLSSQDLFSKFLPRFSSSANLFLEAMVRQETSEDLFAEFEIQDSEELIAEFTARHSSSEDLFAEFEIQDSEDLFSEVYVAQIAGQPSDDILRDDDLLTWLNYLEEIGRGFVSSPMMENDGQTRFSGIDSARLLSLYQDDTYEAIKFGWQGAAIDGSRNRGISFMWWGANTGVHDRVLLQIMTETGYFTYKFSDGPARWTWQFIPWESMQENAIIGSPPDQRRITGIYWIYYSAGLRRLDLVSFYTPTHLKGVFTLRQLTSELKAQFTLRQLISDLSAELFVGSEGSRNLFCEFTII